MIPLDPQEVFELIAFLEDITHDDSEAMWRRRRATELAMLLMVARHNSEVKHHSVG